MLISKRKLLFSCWVWKSFFPVCFLSSTKPVISLMEMCTAHYLRALLFQVLTTVTDRPTPTVTAATSASQCQISSGCVVALMEWVWLPVTWLVWKTHPTNRPWNHVAPFPFPVTVVDVCPIPTAVMESMTVTIIATSISVAHSVSSLYIGNGFWDEYSKERCTLKKKSLSYLYGKRNLLEFQIFNVYPKAFRKLDTIYHS